MKNDEKLQENLENLFRKKDRKKRKRMKVSGKSVFTLARLIDLQTHGY